MGQAEWSISFMSELEKRGLELVDRRLRSAGSWVEECMVKALLTRLCVCAELSIFQSASTFLLHDSDEQKRPLRQSGKRKRLMQ